MWKTKNVARLYNFDLEPWNPKPEIPYPTRPALPSFFFLGGKPEALDPKEDVSTMATVRVALDVFSRILLMYTEWMH